MKKFDFKSILLAPNENAEKAMNIRGLLCNCLAEGWEIFNVVATDGMFHYILIKKV